MAKPISECLTAMVLFCSCLAADEIEFCADLAFSQISLGSQTAVIAVVWNRSNSDIEYSLEFSAPIPRFSDYPASSGGPGVRTIEGHTLDIRVFQVPVETVFDAASRGEYPIEVEFSASGNGVEESIDSNLLLLIGDIEQKTGFFVEPVDVQHHDQQVEAFRLNDDAFRAKRRQRYQEIMGWRDPKDQESYFDGLKEWYSTPEGHFGFGESDDWVQERDGSNTFTLVRDLDCLLDGAYCLSEAEYYDRYIVQYESRKRFGLSSYYEIKQAVHVLKESGKQSALKYLSDLDTSDWLCYEMILRSYVSSRIEAAPVSRAFQGLVYSPEMAPLKRGEDGRLYRAVH